MFRILDCFKEEFDPTFALMAALICAIGSVSTVVAVGRALASRDRRLWLPLLSVCAVSTVWATHFVAMLAYRISIPTEYVLLPTVASYLLGLATSASAFAYAARTSNSNVRIACGIWFGMGVALLHYVGMSAVDIPGRLVFDSGLVLLSVLASCSLGALTFARLYGRRDTTDIAMAMCLFAATVLVLHFSGMRAVTVVLDASAFDPSVAISRHVLAGASAAAALSIVVITLFGAQMDLRMSRLLAAEGLRFRILADGAFEGLLIHQAGVVIDTNEAARRLLLLPSSMDYPLARLFPDEQIPPDEQRAVETHMLRADGSRLPVEINRRAIGNGGNMAAELVAIRDLTPREEAERKLASALTDISTLRALIPMCAWCRKLRDDEGFWKVVEDYLIGVTGNEVSHGMCPDCYAKVLAEVRPT